MVGGRLSPPSPLGGNVPPARRAARQRRVGGAAAARARSCCGLAAAVLRTRPPGLTAFLTRAPSGWADGHGTARPDTTAHSGQGTGDRARLGADGGGPQCARARRPGREHREAGRTGTGTTTQTRRRTAAEGPGGRGRRGRSTAAARQIGRASCRERVFIVV